MLIFKLEETCWTSAYNQLFTCCHNSQQVCDAIATADRQPSEWYSAYFCHIGQATVAAAAAGSPSHDYCLLCGTYRSTSAAFTFVETANCHVARLLYTFNRSIMMQSTQT